MTPTRTVGWLSQAALALGLAISAAATVATGERAWGSLALMTLVLTVGVVLWARFSLRPPLALADMWFAAFGFAITLGDRAAPDPLAALRTAVVLLWVIGGVAGTVAVWRSGRDDNREPGRSAA